MRSYYTFEPNSKEDFNVLSNRINHELSKVNDWLQINNLSLNVLKTKYMIFHNRQKNIEKYMHLKLKINNVEIERTKSFNFLGIIINENLNWSDHVSYISQKIIPVIGLLNRLKHQLPTRILKMIYNSLILSRLHYGNLLWGHTPGSLIALNKRALRAITDAGTNAHTNPIEKRLRLLSIPDIHKIKSLCLCKNIVDNNVPQNIKYMFENLFEASEDNVVSPRTANYQSTIRYALPELIKTTPNEIMSKLHSNRYCSFKWNVKSYIIDRYSSLCTKLGCGSCHLSIKIA